MIDKPYISCVWNQGDSEAIDIVHRALSTSSATKSCRVSERWQRSWERGRGCVGFFMLEEARVARDPAGLVA